MSDTDNPSPGESTTIGEPKNNKKPPKVVHAPKQPKYPNYSNKQKNEAIYKLINLSGEHQDKIKQLYANIGLMTQVLNDKNGPKWYNWIKKWKIKKARIAKDAEALNQAAAKVELERRRIIALDNAKKKANEGDQA